MAAREHAHWREALDGRHILVTRGGLTIGDIAPGDPDGWSWCVNKNRGSVTQGDLASGMAASVREAKAAISLALRNARRRKS